MQILLLQIFSTCFGRQAPIIRSIKLKKNERQLISVIMLYITELPVQVAAVSVFYTPDDGA